MSWKILFRTSLSAACWLRLLWLLKHLLLSDDVQCRLGDLIVDRGDRELSVSIFLFYRWGTWLFFDSDGLDSLVVGLYMNARDFQTIDNNGDLEMEIILSVGSEENLGKDAFEPFESLAPG